MAKPGLRKIGRYSESFRLSAVKLRFSPIRRSGISVN
jgi:hypothetical protein